MAARLVQLKSKAAQASQFVAKHGGEYYKTMVEQNKKYIVEPANIDTCSELSKKLLYTRLASIPDRTKTLKAEIEYVKNIWKNRKDVKVEDVGIGALFGLELYAWFCAGEIVGRGFTFTGYYV